MSTLLGIAYKLGRSDFDYFDDTLFHSYTQNAIRYSNEIRAYAGIKHSTKSSYGITFSLKYYFDAGDANTYNIPTKNDSTVLEEIQLHASQPELKTKSSIQLEYRHLSKKGNLGINPVLNYNIEKQIASFRLQFYFLTLKEDDKAKGLNGGLFAGYQTGEKFKLDDEKSNFLIGIFFSGLFDINSY